jgi:hypothetical protein
VTAIISSGEPGRGRSVLAWRSSMKFDIGGSLGAGGSGTVALRPLY